MKKKNKLETGVRSANDNIKRMRIASRKLLELREHPDGDLYFELDEEILNDLNWQEGDSIKFTDNKDGSFSIKKVTYSAIELDIDKDDLLRYMTYAHEKDMTFNELAQEAVKEMLNKSDFESECG